MKRLQITLSVLASLLLSVPSLADGPTDVRQHMINGSFETAFAQAEQLGSADGYALAAESLLSEIMLGQAKKNKKQAKRARKLAEAGLDLDPKNQNARLQYAIAHGFVTRETGDVSAWMKKLPQKTQAVVQAYREDFPQDVRGDALLGAWHLAIARKAGNENAEKWFEASIAQGQSLFQNARTVKPNDIVISVNYAFSLLALKDDDFPDVEEARQILTSVIATEPTDHLGRVLKIYADEALTLIDDRDAVRDYAGMFLDGEKPTLN
ncbi:MAG: hypothetical protein ABJO36_05735 [Litorimonas sp.]